MTIIIKPNLDIDLSMSWVIESLVQSLVYWLNYKVK